MKRLTYRICGVLCVILAVVGVFVPGLPTTPFLLLAVWLFSHSSPLLLRKLMGNRMLYNYVTNYHRRGGLKLSSKIWIVIFMWSMVGLSILLRAESTLIKYIIIGMALVGTYVMGFVVPTAKND